MQNNFKKLFPAIFLNIQPAESLFVVEFSDKKRMVVNLAIPHQELYCVLKDSKKYQSIKAVNTQNIEKLAFEVIINQETNCNSESNFHYIYDKKLNFYGKFNTDMMKHIERSLDLSSDNYLVLNGKKLSTINIEELPVYQSKLPSTQLDSFFLFEKIFLEKNNQIGLGLYKFGYIDSQDGQINDLKSQLNILFYNSVTRDQIQKMNWLISEIIPHSHPLNHFETTILSSALISMGWMKKFSHNIKKTNISFSTLNIQKIINNHINDWFYPKLEKDELIIPIDNTIENMDEYYIQLFNLFIDLHTVFVTYTKDLLEQFFQALLDKLNETFKSNPLIEKSIISSLKELQADIYYATPYQLDQFYDIEDKPLANNSFIKIYKVVANQLAIQSKNAYFNQTDFLFNIILN